MAAAASAARDRSQQRANPGEAASRGRADRRALEWALREESAAAVSGSSSALDSAPAAVASSSVVEARGVVLLLPPFEPLLPRPVPAAEASRATAGAEASESTALRRAGGGETDSAAARELGRVFREEREKKKKKKRK